MNVVMGEGMQSTSASVNILQFFVEVCLCLCRAAQRTSFSAYSSHILRAPVQELEVWLLKVKENLGKLWSGLRLRVPAHDSKCARGRCMH